MTIEKTDHQIIVDSNQQANAVIQNNGVKVEEKIQSNFYIFYYQRINIYFKKYLKIQFF